MIGYIKAYKPELKVKEYEIYKGIYCSLCKQLGKSYTLIAQLFLNYDFVFLLLLKTSLSSDCPVIQIKRCQYNPFVKCNCLQSNRYLEVCADLVIIITYYKLKDDINDKKTFKKFLRILLLPVLSIMHMKAKRRAPDYELSVSRAMTNQKYVENNLDSEIDIAAEPTAKALSEIFALGEEDDNQRKILERLGYLLGRWAYIIDAVDDIDDDMKSNSFNPFAKAFMNKDMIRQKEQFSEYAAQVLMTTSGEATLAFELLDTKRYRNILENIMYDGLINSAEKVLNNYRRCDIEKPV